MKKMSDDQKPLPTESEVWKEQRDAFARRALDLEAENIVLKAKLERLIKIGDDVG